MLARSEKLAAELRLPLGYVAHATASRTRLSFPDLRGRHDALQGLCTGLCNLAGVHSAEGRTTTGSIIVTHDGGAVDLVRAASDRRLFEVRDLPPRPDPLADAMAWKSWADRSLRDGIGPGVNLRSIAALAFIAVALRQLAAGSIMPPAATALWYGLSLLLAVNPEPGGHAERDGR